MNTKFTPGPWANSGPTQYSEQSEWIYGGPHRARVAQVQFGLNYGQDMEAEVAANAHLIAAAPELYEAAENLVIAIGMGWELDGVVDVMNAALAKARGEA